MTSKRANRWQTLLPAWLVFLVGTIDIISAVRPALADRFHLLLQFLPIQVPAYSRLFVLVSGLVFYILAYHLSRRSRLAWNLATILLIITSIAHLLKGIDYEEVIASLVTLVILWRLRASFHQTAFLPSLRRALSLLVYSFAALITYGTLGFLLFDDRFLGREFSFADAFHNSLLLYLTFTAPAVLPKTLFGRIFLDSAGLISAAFYIYIVIVLFAPILLRLPERSAARRRARELLEGHPTDDLDSLKVAPDKHLFFNEEQSAFISFGMSRGTIIALGDPVAHDQAAGQRCIEEFYQATQENLWRTAFLQTTDRYHEIYKSLGFKSLVIGQDAVVDLSTFSLEGSSMKPIRTSHHQMTRLGYRIDISQAPFSRTLWQELEVVNRDWLTIAGRRERGFSQSLFGVQFENNTVAIVRDPNGMAVAFATMFVYPKARRVAIDLIRRKSSVPNGTMDFLFGQIFGHFKTEGYQTCNLGLVPLSGVGSSQDSSWLASFLTLLYERLSWIFNFKGLDRFKAKFDPHWQQRYLQYQSDTDVVALALGLMNITDQHKHLSPKF